MRYTRITSARMLRMVADLRMVLIWLVPALVLPAVLTRADVIFEIPDDASLLMTVFQENPEGFQDRFRVGFAYYKMGPAANPENSGMRAWFNTPDLSWPV